MTRDDFRKRCSRYAGCGFISRNLQAKCDILQIFEEGYEQGYEDAISKACDWLEEFMQMTPSKKTFIKRFKQAMKGE